MENAFIAINGWAALILISPFILWILFSVWKENRSRYRMKRGFQRDIRELEDLIWEARGSLVSGEIALKALISETLVEECSEYKEDNNYYPRGPEDLDTECNHKELFQAKALLKMKDSKSKLDPIWLERDFGVMN